MKFLGIDPGLSGAVALIDDDAKIIWLDDMPTLKLTKTRREIDAREFADWLEGEAATSTDAPWIDCRAVIESPGVRPGQSAQSGVKTGVGWGTLVGILVALKIPYETVTPQRWQKAILGNVDRGASKDRSRAFCQREYPSADLGKRRTQDRSDALCIARYAWAKWRDPDAA